MRVMDDVCTWACPACGNRVRLSAGLPEPGAGLDTERLDRLAHAVCGCYVLTMPDAGVARLLFALASGAGALDLSGPATDGEKRRPRGAHQV